jgi:hypothetical protein
MKRIMTMTGINRKTRFFSFPSPLARKTTIIVALLEFSVNLIWEIFQQFSFRDEFGIPEVM